MNTAAFNYNFNVSQNTPNFIPASSLSANGSAWTFTAGGNLAAK